MSRFPQAFACILLLAPSSRAAEPSRDGVEYFEKHIRPVLAQYCFECHSTQAKKIKGKLLLDSHQGLVKGGANAMGVTLGNGMYHSDKIRYVKFNGSFGPLKLIAQLRGRM